MGFFSKKNINSEEYEKLSKRLTDAESDIDKITSKFMSLRGLVHRKFIGPEDSEGPEDPEEQTDLKEEVLLKEDGQPASKIRIGTRRSTR